MALSHYLNNLLSLSKSVVAIIAATMAGCVPNVNYPVNNDMSNDDSEHNSWPEAPAKSIESVADDTAPVFIDVKRALGSTQSTQQLAVYIETYNIQAKVIGSLVEIETELTIRNPDDAYIQGKLQIPLPKEAVVTGVAVDITNEEIKHKMVDAVMIPEHRSMRTKNNVSSETAASESSNRFETNIDVILPHGYRTIRMVYTMPLKVESDGSASVLLPMYKNKLRSRSIRVSVNMPEITQPTLSENIGNSFQKKGSVWVLEQTDKNITSEKDIKLTFSTAVGSEFRADKYLERDSKNPDERFFMFDVKIGKNDAPPQELSRIRLIWDASGSRTPKDIQKSIEVVQRLPENSLYELHVFHQLNTYV